MEKKKNMDWWCDRAWIKFGLAITALMSVAILWYWHEWSLELKLVAAIAALIPVHVVEEWVFPGGFHYQYNSMYRSDELDRYPMCRKSDMYTNLIVTFVYVGLTAAFAVGGEVNTGVLIATIIFCVLEFVIHTLFGYMMYLRFCKAGKSTIYGPGTFTAYLGFAVIGVLGMYCMEGRIVTGMDWAIGIGGVLLLLAGSILLPENLIKKKGNPYFFKSLGYFSRFLPDDMSLH